MAFRLGDLAERLGADLRGDPERQVLRLRGLAAAGESDLSFLTSLKYLALAKQSRAGALLVPPDAEGIDKDLLCSADPAIAMVDLLEIFHPAPKPEGSIAGTAVIGSECEISPSAWLGAYVVVGNGCRIEDNVIVHSHATIGAHCRIGRGSVIHPHVTLYEGTDLGEDVIVHAGAVVGSDGHGYVLRDGGYRKVPQVGSVRVGGRVEIGANSTIDRATLDETTIGSGTKIDNLVQVGHNVSLGENCMLCGQAGVAGSVTVGDGVVMAGQSGIGDHLTVGAGVQIAGQSAVLSSVEAGQAVGGTPAIPLGQWKRQFVALRSLTDMRRRLAKIEKRLENLGDDQDS